MEEYNKSCDSLYHVERSDGKSNLQKSSQEETFNLHTCRSVEEHIDFDRSEFFLFKFG